MKEMTRLNPLRFAKRVVTQQERDRLVAESAYLRSAQRHFTPGFEVEDWMAAAAEIDDSIEIRDNKG